MLGTYRSFADPYGYGQGQGQGTDVSGYQQQIADLQKQLQQYQTPATTGGQTTTA